MRCALAIAATVFLMVGCAPLSTAVIGPTTTHALAMWRGTDVREMVVRENGRLVPLTWTRVLGPGLDPAWALMDFHEEPDPRTDVFVVADLHRADDGVRFLPLGPLVERAMSRHMVWVAAHDEETTTALAPHDAPAPSLPTVEAIAWSTDRIVLTLTTTFTVTEEAQPCVLLAGIAWTRTYDVTRDGTVTPISDEEGHTLRPEALPDCHAPVP